LIADPDWAGSPAGQHMLACAVNLLCRLTETVTKLKLAIPPVPVVVATPYGRTTAMLGDALAAIAPWAVGAEVTVDIVEQISDADMVLSFGPPPASLSGPVLCAIADRWRLWVGKSEDFPMDAEVSVSAAPLAPILAACFLASEVFKAARGVVRGKPIRSLGYSLWTGTLDTWSDLDPGPDLGKV
jgi:hypothetical protein